METPPEDPGIHEDLEVQCDAPPECEIIPADDQENLVQCESNPKNIVDRGAEEKTKDDLQKSATYDRKPGEATGDGCEESITESTSHELKQLSRDKEPMTEGRSEETLAASGEETKAATKEENEVASREEIEFAIKEENEFASKEEIEVSSGEETDSSPREDSEPCSRVKKSEWEYAIESENVADLLKILGERSSDLMKLEVEGPRRGRTALHVAAKSSHANYFELAKAILDQLWKCRQDKYTEQIFPRSNGKSFCSVGEYITAVEKNSKKTATELAEECNQLAKGFNNQSTDYQRIVEYINDIEKRSAAHVKIDRNVREHIWTILDPDDHEVKFMFRIAMDFRDCTLLMNLLGAHQQLRNRELLAVTSVGQTMLHIAAMQGCFPLAKRLLDHARERNDSNYVEAVDHSSGLTALQMANDIIGNRSIAEYVKYTLEFMKTGNDEHPCFVEAYPRTNWRRVLESGDVFTMRQLLVCNSRLLLETCEGWTVLHIAILRKNLELLEAVLNAFGGAKKISFGDEYFPSELTWQQIIDKEVGFDQFREDIAHEGPLKGSALELIESMRSDNEDPRYATMKKLLEEYGHDSKDAIEKERRKKDDEGRGEIEISNVQYWKDAIEKEWRKEWDKGYEADVDFIFESEPRKTLLKVHYAGKHPLIFKEFLKSMPFGEDYFIDSVVLRDAQGRTAYHILLDFCENQDLYPGHLILTEIFKEKNMRWVCSNIRDARGRTLRDIILIKNHMGHNILLENDKMIQYDHNFKDFSKESDENDNVGNVLEENYYDPMNKSDYEICFMFYHIATAVKQTNVAQHMWSNILENNPKELEELFKLKEFPCITAYIAASTGNQVMLRLLLENRIDFNFMDASLRNLLHHAANSSLLEFNVLLKCPMIGHCFSTVKDVCEFKTKWDLERKKTTTIFPSRESKRDFNVEKHVTCLNMERKACILLLLQEGVDMLQEDENKKVPNLGPTNDTSYQSWWYELVVKDLNDRRSNFNQAASSLSVVGTLVAATSYIGPLQPPMTFTDEGFLHTNVLIKLFMMSNTLAFVLAMTSVIFAVVPSLPMPQESARLEVKRAESIVRRSLYMLIFSIFFIILSFGIASMVVMQDQDFISGSIWVLVPLIIGCLFCFIAIVSFLVRIMRLSYPNSTIIRCMYQFGFRSLIRMLFDT